MPLLNIAQEVLTKAIRQEKDIKGIQIGKEKVKLSLFKDDMIFYAENHKDYTHTQIHKLLQLIHEFCKDAGYKTNIQKPIIFL